ncbi:MAG: DoxX family protein [Mariprofundaceae bacterium]|nr:DoxX family protein [Mariprofundaceae bacterium]
MKNLFAMTYSSYMKLVELLSGIQPVSLLLFRLWVALAFWHAGVVKLNDPMGTAYLFNYEYHVPIISPDIAATLGTYVELILPWFLAFGLIGRMSALFLFVYNIVAVISYPALWPHGLWVDFIGNEFIDHKVWGLMLLALMLFGPGKLSVDAALARWLWPRFSWARNWHKD